MVLSWHPFFTSTGRIGLKNSGQFVEARYTFLFTLAVCYIKGFYSTSTFYTYYITIVLTINFVIIFCLFRLVCTGLPLFSQTHSLQIYICATRTAKVDCIFILSKSHKSELFTLKFACKIDE